MCAFSFHKNKAIIDDRPSLDMTHIIRHNSCLTGLKMNIAKTKGDGCRQHPYKREQCADRKYPRLRVLGTTLHPQGKEPGQRDTTKNHGRLGGIAKHRDIFKSNLTICLKRQVYNSSVLPAMIYGAETWTLTKQAQNKLAAAQTKMERSMLNITYKDRRTNICTRQGNTYCVKQ